VRPTIGSRVIFCESVHGPASVGIVKRYACDAGGIYAEVDFHGARLRIHPSQLRIEENAKDNGRTTR
jgi:hypothetical protein